MADNFVPLTPDELKTLVGRPAPAVAPVAAPSATGSGNFVPLNEGELANLRSGAGGTTPLGGTEATIGRDKPWYVGAGEETLKYGLGTAGGLGGAALGSGAGPAGTAVSGAAGFGLGMSLGDVLEKKIDEAYGYTPKIPITAEGLRQDIKENLQGAALGELAMRPLAGAVGYGIGKYARTAEKAAGEVAAPAEVAASQARFEAAHQDAAQTAAKAVSDARQAELTKSPLRGEAREEAIIGELGKTPERSLAARQTEPAVTTGVAGPGSEPGQQYTVRQSKFWNAVYGPITRSSKNLGAQFEAIFKPHLNKPIETLPIIQTLAEEEEYAKGIPTEEERLRQQIGLGGAPNAELAGQGRVPQGYSRDVQKVFQELDPNNYRLSRNIRNIMPLTEGQEPIPRLNNPMDAGKLLGIRSHIVSVLPRNDGPSKAALSRTLDSIDEQLGASGVPGAQELRAKYRNFKNLFGKDFYRGISGTTDPIEAMPTIFANPNQLSSQRALNLFAAMQPEEKAVVRNAFADWMLVQGKNGELPNMDLVRPDWAKPLQKLGHQGLLADPQSWIQLSKTIPADIEWANQSPNAFRKLSDNWVKNMRAEQAKVWDKATTTGLQEAKKIGGTTGKQITNAINAGHTSEEKAQAAINAFKNLAPEGPRQAERLASIQTQTSRTFSQNMLLRYGLRMSAIGALMAGAGSRYGEMLAARGGAGLLAGGSAAIIMAAARYAVKTNPERYLALVSALKQPGSDTFFRVVSNMAAREALGTAPDLSAGATAASAPTAPAREPFPKVTFPAREAPDTAFRKALFADRLKIDSSRASASGMATFKTSQYRNALIQGIKTAKTPEQAQALAEQMYNRGLIDAASIRNAISEAKDLPIADELKRDSTGSLLRNYKTANEGERDALNAEIERRFEDNPDAFKKKELAPYKHLILKVLSERDKASESSPSTP